MPETHYGILTDLMRISARRPLDSHRWQSGWMPKIASRLDGQLRVADRPDDYDPANDVELPLVLRD